MANWMSKESQRSLQKLLEVEDFKKCKSEANAKCKNKLKLYIFLGNYSLIDESWMTAQIGCGETLAEN